jgi:hypothetical protein
LKYLNINDENEYKNYKFEIKNNLKKRNIVSNYILDETLLKKEIIFFYLRLKKRLLKVVVVIIILLKY